MTPQLATVPEVPEVHVHMRQIRPSDMAYVMASWRNSWRLAHEHRRMPWRAYKPIFERQVREGVLATPDVEFMIGCLPDDPDTIVSWLCYTPGLPTVHYAYVRKDLGDGTRMRNRGLFRAMLGAIGVQRSGGMAYTFRPQEHSSEINNRHLGVERKLLAAADRMDVVARYVSPAEFIGSR